jgi:fermentation-respiration switch protein FrsA (DUF1100 family)
MRRSLSLTLLGLPLMLALGCSGGGNSNAPVPVTPNTPTANTVLFDPTTSTVPLPNILATATSPDPITGAWTNPTTGKVTVGPRPAGVPMTPPEALAYINLHEMGGTNAVAGMNAPIYLRFAGPVVASTVTPANIKVFQLTPDAAGTENNPLGFTDVSGMFSYRYTAGGTDLFLFPSFPMLPATRYLYVVTNRVKDFATGGAVSATPYFEALKSTVPLTGSLAALEAIRANVLYNPAQPQSATNPILLSGYAKVMNDAIAASATTTITSRADISVLGRFITGASAISETLSSPSASDPTTIPMESALRAFALGSNPAPLPSGLPGKTWSNTITVPANTATSISTFVAGTPASPDLYWAAVLTGANQAVTPAPTTVGTVVLGTLNSADLSMDPVVVAANATSIDLSSVSGAYNPASGVVQGYRPLSNQLAGFYSTSRTVPFVYIAPKGTAPAGGWPLVIFQHGITSQKETVIALAQTLTSLGRAVVAIDLPLHGQLAVPGHTTGSAWGQDFMAIGAPLATRSNIQQGAFNLDRLEFTVRFGGFAGLGAAMPSMTDIKFVGHSLGAIVGAYYLAGNTTLSATGYPYTQTTLNSDMKGYLAVPGGCTAYLIQNSPAFGPTVDSGLAAVGITKNSPTYHQFFQVTQSVIDTVDPASLTTPLAAGLPSRLSGRTTIQESTSTTYSASVGSDGLPIPTNGDLVIGNPYTRYFANALGGREVLGAAGAAVAPGFMQLAYTPGGTYMVGSTSVAHAAGVVGTPFMYTLTGGAPAPKVQAAAVSALVTTPNEGYFQFDQAGIGHSSLLDPTASLPNTTMIQRQMAYFLGVTGASIVIDPTQGGPLLPTAGVSSYQGILLPEKATIFGY